MKKLKLAYFGTPYFSSRLLESLLSDASLPVEVKFVVTRPDRLVGRKQILMPSPVKQIARKFNIPIVEDMNKLSDNFSLKNLDFAFLYAYGSFIPFNLLNLPAYGFLNTHPSLLPKYRGPSPISYPLIYGDQKTGVTLIQLDKDVDHGPVIHQVLTDILPDERRDQLEIRLTEIAFNLLKEVIFTLCSTPKTNLRLENQNHLNATFTRKLIKDDGFISYALLKKAIENLPYNKEELPNIITQLMDHNQTKNLSLPQLIYNLYRGLYPWPGVWTRIKVNTQEKRLKITDVKLLNNKIQINKVQLEGKKEVDFITFQKAYPIF